jgi:hypothetical protein
VVKLKNKINAIFYLLLYIEVMGKGGGGGNAFAVTSKQL